MASIRSKVRDALAKVDFEACTATSLQRRQGQISLPQTVIQIQDGKVVADLRPRIPQQAAVSDAWNLEQALAWQLLLADPGQWHSAGRALRLDGARLGAGLGRAQHRQSGTRRSHHARRLRLLLPVHRLNIDPFAALPLTMRCCFAFGYLLQRCVLNLVIRAPMFNTLLITFGIDVVLTYLAQTFLQRRFPHHQPELRRRNFGCLGATVPWSAFSPLRRAGADRGFMALSARARDSAGRFAPRRRISWRHGSMASIRASIYAVTFGLGAALAGAAGGLYGMVSQINPYIGGRLTAKSFAIAIIGGLDNPLGVIVGGLVPGHRRSR